MQHFPGWIVALALGTAIVVGIFLALQRSSAPAETPVAAQPSQGGIERLRPGLVAMRKQAIAAGAPGVTEFEAALLSYLKEQGPALSPEDRQAMAAKSAPHWSEDELLALSAVQSLAEHWSGSGSFPLDVRGVILAPARIKGVMEVEQEILASMAGSGIPRLRSRLRTLTKLLERMKNFQWPFDQIQERVPGASLRMTLLPHAGIKQLDLPDWFPLLTDADCGALIARRKVFQDSDCQKLFPKSDFPSLYDEGGRFDLTTGLDAPSLSRMRSALESERKTVLSALGDRARAEISEEFASEAGREKARENLELLYDTLLAAFESISVEWPPPE